MCVSSRQHTTSQSLIDDGKNYELGWESLPYSPDLSPIGYYLFLNLKR